jgi:hypothetical protein
MQSEERIAGGPDCFNQKLEAPARQAGSGASSYDHSPFLGQGDALTDDRSGLPNCGRYRRSYGRRHSYRRDRC